MSVETNTIRHAVEAFKQYIEDSTGRTKDDITYPPYLIYYYLMTYKNYVMYEKKKQEGIDNYNESDLLNIPCVELCEIDIVECPCAPASGCTFFKSVHPLPKMTGNGLPINVATIDGGETFNFVRWYNFSDKLNARTKGEREGFYYTVKSFDGCPYLYIYRSCCFDNLQAVTVSLRAEEPLEVLCFPVCGQEPKVLCSPLDEKLILPKELLALVFERTWNAIRLMKSMGRPDVINNDANDSESQVPTE